MKNSLVANYWQLAFELSDNNDNNYVDRVVKDFCQQYLVMATHSTAVAAIIFIILLSTMLLVWNVQTDGANNATQYNFVSFRSLVFSFSSVKSEQQTKQTINM